MKKKPTLNITPLLVGLFIAGVAYLAFSLGQGSTKKAAHQVPEEKVAVTPDDAVVPTLSTTPSPDVKTSASEQSRTTYEAFTAFRGRTNVGINYVTFKSGHSDLGASMGVLESSAKTNIKDALVLGHLGNALSYYSTALTLWDRAMKAPEGYVDKSYFTTQFLVEHRVKNAKQVLDEAARATGMSTSFARPGDENNYHYKEFLPAFFEAASQSIDEAAKNFEL